MAASCGVIRNNVFSLLPSHDNSSWLSSSTTTLLSQRQKVVVSTTITSTPWSDSSSFLTCQFFNFQFSGISAVQQDSTNTEKRDAIVKTENGAVHNGRLTKTLNFTGEKPSTPILDTINHPIHMKNLSLQVINHIRNSVLDLPTQTELHV